MGESVITNTCHGLFLQSYIDSSFHERWLKIKTRQTNTHHVEILDLWLVGPGIKEACAEHEHTPYTLYNSRAYFSGNLRNISASLSKSEHIVSIVT
jgi:hypothetical protein